MKNPLLYRSARPESGRRRGQVRYGAARSDSDRAAPSACVWQAVFGCQIVWVNTNWGLKTYDFGPSQDTFGLFSASLESLTQKIADSVASRLGPALR